MSIKTHFRKYGIAYWAAFLIGGIWAVPIGATVYRMCQWERFGDGHTVLETKSQRIFSFGNRRFGIDKNKDHTLDEVMVNMPISTYMGGPGYRPWSVTITEQDRRDFARVDSLYSATDSSKVENFCFNKDGTISERLFQ